MNIGETVYNRRKIIFFICLITIIGYFLLNSELKRYRTDIQIKPNMKYTVQNREYTVPNIEMKGTGYLLKENFIIDMRNLHIKVKRLFDDLNVEYWASGGTLIGFKRHKTFMPWDDDIDVHTHAYNRLFMFTEKFKEEVKKHDLQCIYMRGMTKDFSYYKGGIRLREKGKKNPVMDVFFVEQVDGKMKKIENWYGKNISYNNNETWEVNDILNVKKEKIDDMEVYMPNNADKILKKQYGNNYDKVMYCGEKYHTIAYDFFGKVIWNTT